MRCIIQYTQQMGEKLNNFPWILQQIIALKIGSNTLMTIIENNKTDRFFRQSSDLQF